MASSTRSAWPPDLPASSQTLLPSPPRPGRLLTQAGSHLQAHPPPLLTRSAFQAQCEDLPGAPRPAPWTLAVAASPGAPTSAHMRSRSCLVLPLLEPPRAPSVTWRDGPHLLLPLHRPPLPPRGDTGSGVDGRRPGRGWGRHWGKVRQSPREQLPPDPPRSSGVCCPRRGRGTEAPSSHPRVPSSGLLGGP